MRQENVFVGLGGNVGDSVAHIRLAISELEILPDTTVVAKSSLYRTAPVGMRNQAYFINAVVRLGTSLAPTALLGEMHRIEQLHGRVRRAKNGPRTLDLDLLLYGDLVEDDSGITIPHPRMHERIFVLLPLSEIAPECVIAGRGEVREILSKLSNQGVNRLDVA